MDNFNIEKEVWKDIPDFEGFYQVSDKGRVRSLDREVWSEKRGVFYSQKGRVLKLSNVHGYSKITLWKNGKPLTMRVHRLVAEALIPNPKELDCVNHKDENKSNNRIENLEWCTQRYNVNYGENSNIRPVVATHVLTGKKTTYPSIVEASRLGDFDHTCISNVCNGRRKTHKNHYWNYLEEV